MLEPAVIPLRCCGLALLACLAASPSTCLAQLEPASELASPVPAPRPRVFGAGTALRLGVRSGVHEAYFTGEALSLELSSFVDDHFSIDVSVGLSNTLLSAVVGSAANGLPGVQWESTVYLDWSFGDDVRFLVGPGLGFEVWTHRYRSSHTALAEYVSPAGLVRAALLLGLEVLTPGRRFGLRVMARPWVGIGAANYGTYDRFLVTGALLVDLGFVWYEN